MDRHGISVARRWFEFPGLYGRYGIFIEALTDWVRNPFDIDDIPARGDYNPKDYDAVELYPAGTLRIRRLRVIQWNELSQPLELRTDTINAAGADLLSHLAYLVGRP